MTQLLRPFENVRGPKKQAASDLPAWLTPRVRAVYLPKQPSTSAHSRGRSYTSSLDTISNAALDFLLQYWKVEGLGEIR